MRERWLWTVLDDGEPMRRKVNEKSDVFIVQHPSSYNATESDDMHHACNGFNHVTDALTMPFLT